MLDMRYRGFGDAADKSETETMLAVLKYQKKSLVSSDPYTFRNELIPLIRKGELFLIAAGGPVPMRRKKNIGWKP